MNLEKINQPTALELVKFFISMNQNIFLFGRRGTGKSDIALKAISDLGYSHSYINLSTIERTDLAGYPDFHDKEDFVKFKFSYFLKKLKNNDAAKTVLLFDELDKAPDEVLNPLLEILLYKKINGEPLDIIGCILTGNLLEENSNSNDISRAILDRGAKYVLEFDFEKWIDWCRENNIHELIIAFLQHNQDFACEINDNESYASASPRGWAFVSHALHKAKQQKVLDVDTIFNIAAGFVGSRAATKFKIWYEFYKKFDPMVHSIIEKNEYLIDVNTLNETEKLVFVTSAAQFAKFKTVSENKIGSKENNFTYLNNLCDFLRKNKIDSEVQTLALTNSFSFDMVQNYNLYKCKKFFDVFQSINDKLSKKG